MFMRHNIVFLSLTLGFLSQVLSAQQISVADAMNQAESFLFQYQSHHAGGRGTTNAPKLSLAYTAQVGNEVHYYVFNRLDSDGFVIMGGDERAQQVLGYSDTGTFDYDRIPDNMRWFLSQYQEQIHYAIEHNFTPSARDAGKRESTARVKADVEPLITSKWNQNVPYNSEIPTHSDGLTFYTGCAATAGAQIINYFKYPEHGIGSLSLTQTPSVPAGHTKETITFSADFENTFYDWDNMLDVYHCYYNGKNVCTDPLINQQAVGTLMYHIAVASHSSFGTNATSSSIGSIAEGLIKYFGYPNTLSYRHRKCYSDQQWEDMIYDELVAGRPVLYSGEPVDYLGHAFVCHGYNASENTYAINWGWGGKHDGFFALSGSNILVPNRTGPAGSVEGSSYSTSQRVVTGFSTIELPFQRHYVAGLEDEKSSTFTVSITDLLKHSTSIAQSGYSIKLENIDIYHEKFVSDIVQLNMKLVDTTTGIAYFCNPIYESSFSHYLFGEYYIDAKIPNDVPTGNYRVMPVYRDLEDDQWFDIQLPSESLCPVIDVVQKEPPVLRYTKLDFGNEVKEKNVTYSNSLYSIYIGMFSLPSYKVDTDISISFKLVNGDDVYYSSRSPKVVTLHGISYGWNNYSMYLGITNVRKNGTYTVIPVCKGVDNTDWVEMLPSSDDIAPVTIEVTGCPLLGDMNDDKVVDKVDISILVDMLLKRRSQTTLSDIDGNGSFSITDITKLVDIIK